MTSRTRLGPSPSSEEEFALEDVVGEWVGGRRARGMLWSDESGFIRLHVFMVEPEWMDGTWLSRR